MFSKKLDTQETSTLKKTEKEESNRETAKEPGMWRTERSSVTWASAREFQE